MKKLLVMAFAVAGVFASHAATFAASMYNGSSLRDGTDKLVGASVYLINYDTMSQESFLAALRNSGNAAATWSTLTGTGTGSARVTGSPVLTTSDDGTFDVVEFTNTEQENGSLLYAYLAAFEANADGSARVLLSWSANALYADGDARTLQYLTLGDSSYGDNDSFGRQGWYSIPATVPEPTTGLLLLMGAGLLGLRRRRA